MMISSCENMILRKKILPVAIVMPGCHCGVCYYVFKHLQLVQL